MSMSDAPKVPPGTYFYVVCGNCGKDVIYKPAVPETGYVFRKNDVTLTCPFCQDRRHYAAAEVAVGDVDE